jgi:hypothetical protein
MKLTHRSPSSHLRNGRGRHASSHQAGGCGRPLLHLRPDYGRWESGRQPRLHRDGVAQIEADTLKNARSVRSASICAISPRSPSTSTMAVVERFSVHTTLPRRHVQNHAGLYRLVLSSAISIKCFWNMAIRLLVNSTMTFRISTGDLIVASLWAYSTANCTLACATSASFA